MLFIVSDNDVDKLWSDISPMLHRSVLKSQGDLDLSDIYNNLKSKSMQLWVWISEGKTEACCVTQIIDHPQKRILTMPFIAGNAMKDWLLAEDKLVGWAKTQGCKQIEGYCRDGWLRVLKNWNKVWTTMRRDI